MDARARPREGGERAKAARNRWGPRGASTETPGGLGAIRTRAGAKMCDTGSNSATIAQAEAVQAEAVQPEVLMKHARLHKTLRNMHG